MTLLRNNKRKVEAAARSMHQFCPNVRAIFPNDVPTALVEAATVYLYLDAAGKCFNRKFAEQLGGEISASLRYVKPDHLRRMVGRLVDKAAEFNRSTDMLLSGGGETAYAHNVRSTMRALFAEGGQGKDDAELIASSFVAFDELVKRFDAHLQGIKTQNPAMFR